MEMALPQVLLILTGFTGYVFDPDLVGALLLDQVLCDPSQSSFSPEWSANFRNEELLQLPR